MSPTPELPPLTIRLAAPRGFCAGVDRAIKIVEMALEKWGAPVYVRHEIVHNRYVVDGLREKGAVFVEELDECPDDRPVVFSAHGVPKSVPEAASARQMLFVDATCPLVSKVHIEAERHAAKGLQIVMIGHAGHPETAEIAAALKAKFPAIQGPHKEDICYATTNRQEAVKAMAPQIEALLVIGAPNSSNSKRLVEVGKKSGCAYSQLVQRAADIDWTTTPGPAPSPAARTARSPGSSQPCPRARGCSTSAAARAMRRPR